MEVAAVRALAAQELKTHIRSKWVLLFGVVFGTLALAISCFGLAISDVSGFAGFTRTSASVLNLALYLVPLVSLTAGALAFTGDKGAAELLFSQPVSRGEILAGKVLGLFSSVLAATVFGLGGAGAVIGATAGLDGVFRYAFFVALVSLLALIFVALGTAASAIARDRLKALGYALFLWFFFVLFYDLLVIGAAFALPERTANLLVFVALLANPVDMVRVAGMMSLSGGSIFGVAGAALVRFVGGPLSGQAALAAGLTLWSVVPLWFAGRILCRQDI